MRKKATSIMLIAPLMLSLLGIYAPVQVAYATPILSVTPTNSVADLDSFFDITLHVDSISDLVVYDIALSYDETLLEYMGSAAPAPWTPFITDVLPGRVRIVAAVFGGGTVNGPADLVTHTFRMDLSGRSLLHVSSSLLGVLGVGGVPHSAADGTVQSSQATRSDVRIFNAHADGGPEISVGAGETCIDLRTKVSNTGATTVMAIVAYSVVGPAGGFGLVSAPVSMGAGDKTDFVIAFCPPELAVGDTYIASALLVADGIVVETRHFNSPISVAA